MQRWTRRRRELEFREEGVEEDLWDVVVLDNGARADVVGTRRTERAESVIDGDLDDVSTPRPASFIGANGDDEPFEAIQRPTTGHSLAQTISHISLSPTESEPWSDAEIKAHFLKQLPAGSHASITTEEYMGKTVTVNVFDSGPLEIAPPPGAKIVAERHHVAESPGAIIAGTTPWHTVVFQTASKRSRRESFGADDVDQDETVSRPRFSLELPSPRENSEQEVRDRSSSPELVMEGVPSRRKPHDGDLKQEVPSNEPNVSSRKATTSANEKRSRAPKSDPTRDTAASSSRVSPKANSKNADKQKATPFQALRKSLSPNTSSASLKDFSFLPKQTMQRGSTKPPPNNTASRTFQDKPLPRKPAQVSPSNATRPTSNPSPVRQPDSARAPTRASASRADYHQTTPSRETSSRTGYYTVREQRQGASLSKTNAYAIHSVGSRPSSPTATRTHSRRGSNTPRVPGEDLLSLPTTRGGLGRLSSSPTEHTRTMSLTSSLYSVATAASSETSLVLAPRPSRRELFKDQAVLDSLVRDGKITGTFPDNHLVQNVQRFMRFSSASYGSNFLKVMGIASEEHGGSGTKASELSKLHQHHFEHSSFSTHTGLPASTILLSSFIDPAGGSNAAGETAPGFPLVHFLSLDHESKAIVLTLRGTLGFEDILTDMTCDYDDLTWQGRTYQVHKGMHASARHLLHGGGGRVMATIKASLEEFPNYGLVLCGHSLGGGVASLLAILISEPSNATRTSFVTSNADSTPQRLLASTAAESRNGKTVPHFALPVGRPIHVYAYGPPAVMSPHLRLSTRGLITTIINGADVVPSLSLGVLSDFQALALAFKSDSQTTPESKSPATPASTSSNTTRLKSRLWSTITASITSKFSLQSPFNTSSSSPFAPDTDPDLESSDWALEAISSLRAVMTSAKLLPPGEVYIVETMRVLQRDAFTAAASSSFNASSSAGGEGVYPRLGRPATRVQMKYVRDVEKRFAEIRFTGGMLVDHSPGRYERVLRVLGRGVCE